MKTSIKHLPKKQNSIPRLHRSLFKGEAIVFVSLVYNNDYNLIILMVSQHCLNDNNRFIKSCKSKRCIADAVHTLHPHTVSDKQTNQ